MLAGGEHESPDAVSRLSSLDDPVRRGLYEHVAAAGQPVSREGAAKATGISRTLAAYHLDKLVEAGLLSTDYARPDGRRGPGAGRPAKRYLRSQDEVTVSIPPRNYVLLARLLSDAAAADDSGALLSGVGAAARRAGRAAAATGRDVLGTLREIGYEPQPSLDGGIELRNCPFHRLAYEHRDLVCGLNLQLVQGVLEGCGLPSGRAELAPRAGYCCVTIRAC